MLDKQRLPGFVWVPERQGTIWFVQPELILDPDSPPFVARVRSEHETPLNLLRSVVLHEQSFNEHSESAPTLVLLPEFAIDPAETEQVRNLVKSSRPNTVFIIGFGQMTSEQALTIEDNISLWVGPAEGRFTNCAVIGIGGHDRLHLQPKIVPSGLERDFHWRGRHIRLFVGDYVSFAVVICSELLARPENHTTIDQFLDDLRKETASLSFVAWIQHNPKPRSGEFHSSLEQLARLTPKSTVFVIGSRGERPRRIDNFGVSGAIVPHEVLPSRFQDLDRRYRYVEPCPASARSARVVLLRYDADAYRVRTVLASSLSEGDGTAKSALFETADPYVSDGSGLTVSTDQHHLMDLSERAVRIASAEFPQVGEALIPTRTGLVELGTAKFLRFLDTCTLPTRMPPPGGPENESHQPGCLCRCWPHRECLDKLADDDETARPLANVLAAASAMHAAGLQPLFVPRPNEACNCRINIDGGAHFFVVLFTHNLTYEGVKKMMPRSVMSPLYLFLGSADAPPGRPSVSRLDAGRANPTSDLDPARASDPLLRMLFKSVFWAAFATNALEGLFVANLAPRDLFSV